MWHRKRTGALKNIVIKTVAVITIYRSQLISQPTHSSYSGQVSTLPSHSSARVTKHDTIMETKQNDNEMRNIKNTPWFRIPTQLLSHGQWWSKRSTHRLQMAQWRDLGVRKTRQSGHISQGCIFESSSIKSYDGRRYPGSRAEERKKLIAMNGLRPAIMYAKMTEFYSNRK